MSPEQSFLASITKTSNAADLVDKLGEVALDKLLSDGVLKDIPVIGTAITLFLAGNDVAAYFFTKKIVAFLVEIEKIPQEKRRAFVEQECADEESKERVGEVTLMLLEKFDHPLLAKFLGRAFVLMVDGGINRQTFDMYSGVIKNLNSYLVRQLQQLYEYENAVFIDEPAAFQLSIYGLAKMAALSDQHSVGRTVRMPGPYGRTDLGAAFFEKIIRDV